MFKILNSRKDDPGFDGAILIVNQSQFWISIDKEGNQIPPVGIMGVDSAIASSDRISRLVDDGLIVVSQIATPEVIVEKKKKKQDLPQKNLESIEKNSPQVKSDSTIVANTPIIESDTLVADAAGINWVSSNENIVDPTTSSEVPCQA